MLTHTKVHSQKCILITFMSMLRPEDSIFYISDSDNSLSDSTGKENLMTVILIGGD